MTQNSSLDTWAVMRAHINLTMLAEELGISKAAVSAWTCVPAKRVLDVSRLLGVPREQLRPDLYPSEPWSAL